MRRLKGVKVATDKRARGFLLIKKTYPVRCEYCGWKGDARLGSSPIVTDEKQGADWCPRCGALALIADRESKK